MSTDNGWIKLHRSLVDHPRFMDPDWLAVWAYLLLSATHQPRRVDFDGKLVELKPGQLVTGRLTISEKTGVEESKVRRILKVMKSDQQIDQLAGTKGSMFTVLNWQLYQSIGQQIDQQVTSDRPTSDQQVTTNKNGRRKELKKGSPAGSASERISLERGIAHLTDQINAIDVPRGDLPLAVSGRKKAEAKLRPLVEQRKAMRDRLSSLNAA